LQNHISDSTTLIDNPLPESPMMCSSPLFAFELKHVLQVDNADQGAIVHFQRFPIRA